jgi:hypothetical protein
MADRPDQHRLGGTPAHRQPSLEQHVQPGLPLGLAVVRAVVEIECAEKIEYSSFRARAFEGSQAGA